jgi:hypothetical protein
MKPGRGLEGMLRPPFWQHDPTEWPRVSMTIYSAVADELGLYLPSPYAARVGEAESTARPFASADGTAWWLRGDE